MRKFHDVAYKVLTILKLLVAFSLVYIFGYRLRKKNLWLISEKVTEARDNGYHLFTYLRQKHPSLSAYYVIMRESPDLSKVAPLGNIIKANSFKHFCYYLSARHSISSQPGGACPEPKSIILRFRSLARADQDIVFLQHGIIKDELTHGFDYNKTHYSLFVCSSVQERNFVEKTYLYPKGIVKNLGLCRFDNLHNKKHLYKKQVLVMPTFRRWLISKNMPGEASDNENKQFRSSNFFKIYQELLEDRKLLEYLEQKGYKLVFYPHYALQPYIKCFSDMNSKTVIVADRWHYDVQQLLIESACLITDFSSVFFDFAYMEKPEIFYQFDEKEYRATHYKKGYFDYREDGFGPVFQSRDQLVDYLIKTIENGCRVEEKYVNRINQFFDKRDNHNCKRTYEAIKLLEEE